MPICRTQRLACWTGRTCGGLALGLALAVASEVQTGPEAAFSLADGPFSGWVNRVNAALSQSELEAVRLSAQRGRPLGDEGWVESIARRLNLESTMRPRGRQRVRFPHQDTNKET